MDLLLKLRKAYPDRYSEIKKAHDFARDAHAGLMICYDLFKIKAK